MRLSTLALPTYWLIGAAIAAETAAPEETPFPWPNPFNLEALKEYDTSCENSITLPASEYLLHDLFEQPPLGLWPWADALKAFFSGQEYPGSWEGTDPHGYDRPVLKMEYEDVPKRVRDWIAAKGKRQFAVYKKPEGEWSKVSSQSIAPKTKGAGAEIEEEDELSSKVVIFAPGALYSILPLFAAEGSSCAGAFEDLERYTAEPKDGAVIAGVVRHTVPDRESKERDIQFEIKAQALKLKDAGKDEL